MEARIELRSTTRGKRSERMMETKEGRNKLG